MADDVQCAIHGDPAVSDAIADRYAQRMTAISNEFLHGRILDVEEWQTKMQDAIRLAFIHQAVAGAPDADERLISSADRDRIEAAIAKQYQYLDNFVDDIVGAIQRTGASLDFIPNRAALYAGSSKASYWQQAVGVDLPHVPGDGSTQCLGRCSCSVRTECEYDDSGKVIAVNVYWELDPEKEEVHCSDCPDRAAEWNPLRIEV